jgi:hypothetical protein
VLVATRDERRLGQQLSGVLARAHGSYIAVTALRDARRRRLGVVFHYGGNPSWVFATLDRPLPPGRNRVTLVTQSGAVSELGTFVLEGGERSLGSTVRLDLRKVMQLRLREERRGTTYVANF